MLVLSFIGRLGYRTIGRTHCQLIGLLRKGGSDHLIAVHRQLQGLSFSLPLGTSFSIQPAKLVTLVGDGGQGNGLAALEGGLVGVLGDLAAGRFGQRELVSGGRVGRGFVLIARGKEQDARQQRKEERAAYAAGLFRW